MSDDMIVSYEEWVEKIFNNSDSYGYYYWDDTRTYFEVENKLSDDKKIEYVTRLFENAKKDLSSFEDKNVRAGLYYIIDTGSSDYMDGIFELKGRSVDSSKRKLFIESIYGLFANCMGKRCSETLGHLDEEGGNAINSVCYMWWDILPIISSVKSDEYLLFLDVMKKILSLNNVACQESALHGLGHWQMYHPEIVEEIVGGYIAKFDYLFVKKKKEQMVIKNKDQDLPKILTYAMQARGGCVQ